MLKCRFLRACRRVRGVRLLALAAVAACPLAAAAQSTNQILSVSPNPVEAGSVGLTISFTLDTDAPPPPPTAVTAGCITVTAALASGGYVIVDTGQERCYDATGEVGYPAQGSPFHGQDAQYQGAQPSYRDNRDGTITDLNTGLMWQQDPGAKMTYEEAVAGAAQCRVAGHSDWRLPTIKELYSLIDFRGCDPRPEMSAGTEGLRPFIDTNFFRFQYGRAGEGDRIIDSQYASGTLYVSTTMGGNKTMFGVNFADGRIKGYPAGPAAGGRAKKYCVLYVRGNPDYGRNRFVDNGDGTITDAATGLMWQQGDSGKGMDWADALAYAGRLSLAGHRDWRLPNAKELQSIVDYTRSPDRTGTAAIDPVFRATSIRNEARQADFACYWTGTTHAEWNGGGSRAVYVAFGRAMGFMRDQWMDVHGAGAQRSDPKRGDPADYPRGRGPQGDAIRILNYARCVRGGTAAPRLSGPPAEVRAGGGDLELPRETGGHPPGFVGRLDRDGDGKVSRQEFDGPPDHFPVLDRNRDGYLTEDEAPLRPPFPRSRSRE